MASLSPVTAGQPVAEARFVRTILLPARTPSLRRVFRDSDHAECPLVLMTCLVEWQECHLAYENPVTLLLKDSLVISAEIKPMGDRLNQIHRKFRWQ